MARKLLEQLSLRHDLRGSWRFILYFNRSVPADVAELDPELFTTRVIGVPSFSLYYYVGLPLRLWWDRPSASLAAAAQVATLDQDLRAQNLSGVTLRGDAPLWLGARNQFQITQAVKTALDAENRFPGLDD